MNITLYGAGYIGLALLAHLEDHSVTIVTRTRHQEHALFHHLSHEKNTSQEIENVLSDSDIIICTITPHDQNYALYSTTAEFLTKAAPNSFFIYTSSIGVYGGTEGEITEATQCTPTTERTKHLLMAEQRFLTTNNACIFRLGGIYGPGRTILDRFIAQGYISGPKTWPTNMIHRDDVVGAILFALTKKPTGIYNLVDCEHPSREDLYVQIAEAKGISLPEWRESTPLVHGGNRKVNNQKLLHAGYHMIHPTKNLTDF